MARMVDVLKQDHDARCGRTVTFPWSPEPFVFDPVTAEDLAEAGKGDASGMQKNIRMLIRKAKRTDGSAMFEPGDFHLLNTKAATDRLGDLMDAMFGGVPSAEQVQAIVADPPSSSASA